MIRATAIFRPRNSLGRFVDAVVSPAVEASVEAACDLIMTSAKLYCPVDTGNLQDSIKVEVVNTGSTVKGSVSTDVSYAPYVEFGTGQRGAASPGAGEGPYSGSWPGMPAQPFIRPALDENRAPIADLFRNNLTLAVEGA